MTVAMPSQYSSPGSMSDAQLLAKNLAVQLLTFPIQDVFQEYLSLFAESFRGLPSDVTEENLQARIRGNILMALSNKFGWLVLTTGNKSEISVGYSTLYGDSVGGFAPLKDVFKTMVYRLSSYRNALAGHDLIPRAILEKVPSAELRPNQTDQDSLPPYDVLDRVLSDHLIRNRSAGEIAADGTDIGLARSIVRMVEKAEYKRRQAPPVLKVSSKAFGMGRRIPIARHFE